MHIKNSCWAAIAAVAIAAPTWALDEAPAAAKSKGTSRAAHAPSTTRASAAKAPPPHGPASLSAQPMGQVMGQPTMGMSPMPGAAPADGAPAAPTGPTGKAEIKETVYDAGTIDRGTDVTHAFEIKNIGKADLTVDAKPG